MTNTLVTRVNPLRVRTLLLSALDLFSKGSTDGKLWIQHAEKSESPIVGNRYGYCSIGAINHVEGFTEDERAAARIALAKMIDRDLYSGKYLEDQAREYADEYAYDHGVTLEEAMRRFSYESNPYLVDDLIVNTNDDDYTTFEQIRGFFSGAAARLKKKA